MRLVRFEDESGGFAVDLHPLITVISGLPAHVRDRLVHGLASLPRGTDPGGRGSLEVHGVFLDLSRENLELLELNQDLDVILRAGDLPGAEPVKAQVAEEAQQSDGFESTGAGSADAGLRDARRFVEENDDAYEAAVRDVERYRSEIAEVERTRAAVASELDEARSGLDSFAVAGLKISQEELAELEAREAAPPSPASPTAAAALTAPVAPVAPVRPIATVRSQAEVEADRLRIESRLSDLIDESDRLRRLMKAWRAIDPEPVRRAFAMRDVGETVSVASPEAEALAAEFEQLELDVAELAASPADGREQLDRLTAARDDAFDAFKRAERNLRSPELDPALVDRLETAHDEIFELDGKTSRFGAGKLRRRLESLRAEEALLLEQMGFDSWSSYIMGITSAASDPSLRRDFEAAGRAYERAESALATAAAEHSEAPADPRIDEAAAKRASLERRVEDLLGHLPDDPIGALRAVRVEVVQAVTSPDGGDEAAASALRSALEGTGAQLPSEDLSLEDLRSIAGGWLETMDTIPGRIAEAQETRDALEAEISELAVELDALPEPGSPDDGLNATESEAAEASPAEPEVAETAEGGSAVPDAGPDPVLLAAIAQARERVAEGEARVELHERAVARIAELESEGSDLADRVRDLEQRLADHEPRVATLLEQRVAARNRLRRAEASRPVHEPASWESRLGQGEESPRFLGGSAGAEAVEWYVLARLAQQRSVSFVGSVPLVIDDAFVNWPFEAMGELLARLERMGEVIQIVFLTDDPGVGNWARDLGPDRALVLDMRLASAP